MKKFSSVFSCFHTDMNKYIFPVQQKISGNFLEIFRNIFFRKSYITINCPSQLNDLETETGFIFSVYAVATSQSAPWWERLLLQPWQLRRC